MKIADIIACLSAVAPSSLQESYDNAGLITGSPAWECMGAVICLDSIEAVIDEAVATGFNLVIAHHPIIFSGLKKLSGDDYVSTAIIKAIKNDVAIFAVHTNLDNVIDGVNRVMADKLGLLQRRVLAPRKSMLQKLHVFVPASHEASLTDALFAAGAGNIGNYSECSFSSAGTGSFRAGAGTHPFVGREGVRHMEAEKRLEVIFPDYLSPRILQAMKAAHPYEEVAYDLVTLANTYENVGAGLVGELPEALPVQMFLQALKDRFGLAVVRHTTTRSQHISRVAVCGGAGSFLITKALQNGADAYVTADLKYHEFFDANDRLLLCDIGHFESEQFTIDLLYDILREKFPNFAVLKTKVKTNPVSYFCQTADRG